VGFHEPTSLSLVSVLRAAKRDSGLGDPQREELSMDLINTLKGEGTGVSKNKTTQVAYELGMYQHWLTVCNDKAVPGLQKVH
jgi:hypothetical protein